MNSTNFTIICNVFNNSAFYNLFRYLYSRWQDEYEYEDIQDYRDMLLQKFNQITNMNFNDNFIMTTSPFGFRVRTNYQFKNGITALADVVFKIENNGDVDNVSWQAMKIIS